MKRCSDKRLKRLVRKALLAIEDPDRGILLDDFDLRYREQEAKREADAARWFYRDKTPFETKYGEDCGADRRPAAPYAPCLQRLANTVRNPAARHPARTMLANTVSNVNPVR